MLGPFIGGVLFLVIVGMGSAAYSLGVIAGALIQSEDDDVTTDLVSPDQLCKSAHVEA